MNGGFFVLEPAVLDYIDGDGTLFEPSRSSVSPPTDSCAPTGTAASGSPWTRCATSARSRSCGTPAARLGRPGDVRGRLSGRRVFVTGHTGFKGSWLTQWLLDLGADVTGYSLAPPTEPSLFEAAGIGREEAKQARGAGRFTDLRADVRERRPAWPGPPDGCPEIVFHLAAQPLVRRSYAEPHLTYETNVMGTVNLLEEVRVLAACGRGPRAVVNVTSDKCYENHETGHAYVEGDPLGGFDPYSSSKGCSELVTVAYRRSFFNEPGTPRVATARAGNVIGGGDWGEDRILPDCARALSAGVPVLVRNPGAVRPWQHVLESLSGYLWLGAKLCLGNGDEARAFDGAWNFGPASECCVTVREVVELFVRRGVKAGGGRRRGLRSRPMRPASSCSTPARRSGSSDGAQRGASQRRSPRRPAGTGSSMTAPARRASRTLPRRHRRLLRGCGACR